MEKHDADNVTPDDLIAYADGEAPPDVAARIASDPPLRDAATVYAARQRRLTAQLYRFACPPAQTLGEYELGLLSAAERSHVAAHVRDCLRCADELAVLRDFLPAEPLPEPGSVAARVRRWVATLVPPAGAAAPVPVRGAGDDALRTYGAGDITITLSMDTARQRKHASLIGLVLHAAEGASVAGTATLSAEGRSPLTTPVDEWGNFTFDDLVAGAYRLEVTLGEDIITIEAVSVAA